MKAFIKDGAVVLEDNCNRFLYEVFLFINFEGSLSLGGYKIFSSEKELNIIPSVKLSKYKEIVCELYSAPKRWLIDNDFNEYNNEKRQLNGPKRKNNKSKLRKDDK